MRKMQEKHVAVKYINARSGMKAFFPDLALFCNKGYGFNNCIL